MSYRLESDEENAEGADEEKQTHREHNSSSVHRICSRVYE